MKIGTGFTDALAQSIVAVGVDCPVRQGDFVQPVAAVAAETGQAVVGQVAGFVVVVDATVDAVQAVNAGVGWCLSC